MKTAKTKKKTSQRSTRGGQQLQRRVMGARKNLDRMLQELAPYFKPRRVEQVSTAGKWCDTSSMTFDLCHPNTEVEEEARG